MKTKTVIEIDYNELNELVKGKLGYKKYRFGDDGVANDSIHSFEIDGKLDDYQIKECAEYAAGTNEYCSDDTVLNKLCAEGHIPAGEYLVSVCW